jgi:hypothetical protein
MFKKNNIIQFLFIILLILWQISFYNTFTIFMPFAFIIIILFISYNWQNSLKIFLVPLIIYFEFLSPHFPAYYLLMFLIITTIVYLLNKQLFISRSRTSLMILVLISEIMYFILSKIFLWFDALFKDLHFNLEFNYIILLKDLFINILWILLINEIIKFIKNKFLIRNV